MLGVLNNLRSVLELPLMCPESSKEALVLLCLNSSLVSWVLLGQLIIVNKLHKYTSYQ